VPAELRELCQLSLRGAHHHAMARRFSEHASDIRDDRRGPALLAGAYRRQIELISTRLVADTSTRAVTIVTPTLFCDLRIANGRPAAQWRAACPPPPSMSADGEGALIDSALGGLSDGALSNRSAGGIGNALARPTDGMISGSISGSISDSVSGSASDSMSDSVSDSASDSALGRLSDGPLAGLSDTELADLATHTHTFCGAAEVVGGTASRPEVERSHGVDWQPSPRTSHNRWMAEPQWEHGGWVEWGAADAHGQPKYIEHWLTLHASREGPFVALRRRPHPHGQQAHVPSADGAVKADGADGADGAEGAGGGGRHASSQGPSASSSCSSSLRSSSGECDAYLLVAGDHFAYAQGRPAASALPVVRPGIGGHPADRGRVEPLVKAALHAGERQTLLNICHMVAHYGCVSGGPIACEETRRLSGVGAAHGSEQEQEPRWRVLLSSRPWCEGASLQPFVRGLVWSGAQDGGLPSVVVAADGREWEVFEAVGRDGQRCDEVELRALLS
jgi:hypothetical protein